MIAIFAAEKIIWEDSVLTDFVFWSSKDSLGPFDQTFAQHLKKYRSDSLENLRVLMSFFRGKKLEELEVQAKKFVQEHPRKLLQETVEKIYEAKALGKKVIVTSNYPEFLIKALLRSLPIDELMGARLVTDSNQICTGEVTAETRTVKNRLKTLKSHYRKEQFSWCVAGSFIDLPILDLAIDQKIAFNPDRELLSYARERNWTVRFKKL